MEGKNHGSPSFVNVAALLLFAIVIAVASVATTYFVLNSRSNEQYAGVQPSIVSPPQSYIQPTITLVQQTQTGFIEGETMYPSDAEAPADIEVCAINSSKQEYCVKPDINLRYRLEVSIGKYYVFTRILSANYKAYYTESVICQLSPPTNCPSHKPITVEVISGKTISDINPTDLQEYFEDSFLIPLK